MVGGLRLGRRGDPDQVGRGVAAVGVDEANDDLVVAVELGNGAELVLGEDALDAAPVDEVAELASRRYWSSVV